MARSHSFWVIVSGDTPTSFRANDRETLLPTLRQLQRTQPDASLRWFERNRLWNTPEEARDAGARQGFQKKPAGWRPGGDHKDPRAKYDISRDEKRARFKRRQERFGPPDADRDARPKSDAPRLMRSGRPRIARDRIVHLRIVRDRIVRLRIVHDPIVRPVPGGQRVRAGRREGRGRARVDGIVQGTTIDLAIVHSAVEVGLPVVAFDHRVVLLPLEDSGRRGTRAAHQEAADFAHLVARAGLRVAEDFDRPAGTFAHLVKAAAHRVDLARSAAVVLGRRGADLLVEADFDHRAAVDFAHPVGADSVRPAEVVARPEAGFGHRAGVVFARPVGAVARQAADSVHPVDAHPLEVGSVHRPAVIDARPVAEGVPREAAGIGRRAAGGVRQEVAAFARPVVVVIVHRAAAAVRRGAAEGPAGAVGLGGLPVRGVRSDSAHRPLSA